MTSDATGPRGRLVVLGALFLVAVFLRGWSLGTLPGVNGDEAWPAVQLQLWMGGGEPSWVTPNGNVWNPFLVAPMAVMLALTSEPALWMLRVPSLLAGLLLMALAYPLARKRVGDDVAVTFALLVSSLPIHITYARFGWDTSQTGLFALLVLWAALSRRWIACGALGLCSLLVHPTNVFLLPIVAGLFAAHAHEQGWLADRPRAYRRGAVLLVATTALGAALWWVLPARALPEVGPMLERLVSPLELLRMGLLFVRLLTGHTAFTYVVGDLPGGTSLLLDVVGTVLLVTLLVVGGRALWAGRKWRALGLCAGIAAAVLALYVVGGTRALSPHTERYGVFLTVPSCLAIAMLLRAALAERPKWHRAAAVATAMALLTLFSVRYVVELQQTGGYGHPTFRAGPVEPKQAALQKVLARAPDGRVTIAAESFWLDMPVRYLAHPLERVEVVALDGVLINRALVDGAESDERVFALGFVGGSFERFVEKNGLTERLWSDSVPAYDGQPAVLLWELKRGR